MSTTTAPKIFHTAIDLPVNVRTTVIELLNGTLADLNDLKSQTKYAHWNVKGPSFYSLHLLFDQLASGFDEQIDTVAERIAKTGCRLFRGGAYKPRTSPYSFQGLGEPGLKILAKVREQHGFGIITEAIDNESLDLVEQYADVIQIGARNMQNFSLLKRAGRARKPVLLKRGMSATLDEFLMAAEYILSEGNYNVMLCERGVRTFSDFSRNTLDLAVVPAVKKRSHLPILVDPSHGTGKRHKVLPLSRAAVAVGADGLLVEVHHEPDKALSDGVQSIVPEEFAALTVEVRQIAEVLRRHVN